MNRILSLVAILPVLFSCTQPHSTSEVKSVNLDSIKQVLIKTDQEFSDRSKKIGQQEAFLEYMDQHVTMLRPNSMPLVGKDTLLKIYSQRSDTGFTLTWSPLFADVAGSGDLGYTYGTWRLTTRSGDKEEGTYCSIWKKDEGGKWKFVVDVGNDGLKPPEAKK